MAEIMIGSYIEASRFEADRLVNVVDYDADGVSKPAWLILADGTFALAVFPQGATYEEISQRVYADWDKQEVTTLTMPEEDMTYAEQEYELTVTVKATNRDQAKAFLKAAAERESLNMKIS